MSRSDRDRLLDILEATAAIAGHLRRGPLTDGLVFDAVRVRLIEIGEAVKDLDPDLLVHQPQIPWRQVAAMRDQLAHRYFDTSHTIVQHTTRRTCPSSQRRCRLCLTGPCRPLIRPTDSRTPLNSTGLWGSVPLLPLAHDRRESRSKMCHR